MQKPTSCEVGLNYLPIMKSEQRLVRQDLYQDYLCRM